MPRGKNYVNNNRGVSMQASKKKKAPSMEQCFYGKGCTRADCFYRHDNEVGASGDQSKEPCMPFLAGLCTFSASGCRKRHPPKEEASRLIQKYKSIKCRYGEHCKTAGCLYVHPGDDGWDKLNQKPRIIPQLTAFPPLGGAGGVGKTVANGGILSVPKPMGAWKPMQPTGVTCKPVPGPKPVVPPPPQKSAWKPAPPPATSAWGPKPPKLQQPPPPHKQPVAAAPASNKPANQQRGRPVGTTTSPASGGMKNGNSTAPKNGNTTNAVVKPATTPMNGKAPAFTPAMNGNAPALAASPTPTTPMNGKAPVFKPAMNANAPSPTTTVMMNGMTPAFTPKATTSAPSMMNGMAPAFTPSPVNDGMAQPATPTTPMNGMAPAFTPTSMMTTNDGMDAYQQPYLPDHSTNYDYGYNIDNGMMMPPPQQQFHSYEEPMTYEYNDVPQPSPRTAARLLNINANEYVPGGGPGY